MDDPFHLQAVQECEVLVLMDNVIDLLSSTPSSVKGEISGLAEREGSMLAGRCLCCAHWGLSLMITARGAAGSSCVLFDSGPEGTGLRRNIDRLGVDLAQVDEAVVSHGHWDHTGGMLEALSLMREAKGGRTTPVHLNEGMFVKRGIPRAGGGILPFEDVPTPALLKNAGGEPVVADDARWVGGGRFWLSGEIPRVTSYEKGLPGHLAQDAHGQWQPDPWVSDERWMAVHVRGLGLLVFTACSHAGVVNVLRHARLTFPEVPLYGVLGGLHLSGSAFEPLIAPTVADLRSFGLRSVVPGHCTGWRAVRALVDAFGEQVVVPSSVGRRHLFASPAGQ
jgi:7,8-dihydropterin-6-yl-methyl-4-(beta-D-ribofuranosyl)aminobenzene 5'-phosphate synthase